MPDEHDVSVRDIDVIFRETDRLYYLFARDCGLSNAAFWSLVSIVGEGGSATQSQIADEYSFSRQTVNSAIKALEERGLVHIDEAAGRRNKAVSLTREGDEFCRRHIRPAIEAERRAFDSLTSHDRTELARLVRVYTEAIDAELGKLLQDRREQGE